MELCRARCTVKIEFDQCSNREEGRMKEYFQYRMFGPWNALQHEVAGPAIERI
jgi:hypothetical protein